MLLLVNLPDLKKMLKIETDEQDTTLLFYIQSASAVILRYLGARAAHHLPLAEDGELDEDAEIPAQIQHAVAALVGHFLAHPDEDPEGAFGHGRLPWFVTALLYQMRDPALA